MDSDGIEIRPFTTGDRSWADDLISGHQDSSRTVRLGEVIDPLALDGFVAWRSGRRTGLLTHRVDDTGLDVVTLHAAAPGTGAGGALLTAAVAHARHRGLPRLWLLTTSDSLDAIAFYQRRGLRLCAVHPGAVDADRHLKPELPLVNPTNGIGIHDLLEFERVLG